MSRDCVMKRDDKARGLHGYLVFLVKDSWFSRRQRMGIDPTITLSPGQEKVRVYGQGG